MREEKEEGASVPGRLYLLGLSEEPLEAAGRCTLCPSSKGAPTAMSGKERQFRVSPGYYGPHGFPVLCSRPQSPAWHDLPAKQCSEHQEQSSVT